ncbi:MAG: DUF1501 domain-containing protein [Phycisphaerae bacterium]|nr:DUF1501 domain-containing protein [Phycisphaerae bacterium]
MLKQSAGGFGAVALGAMLSEKAFGASTGPWTPRPSHFAARAKNVIFLYMDGGPSQVDTFDYKPALEKFHGQDPRKAIGKLEPTQFNNIGKVMKSPWKFKQYGESGHWVSDLFPHIAKDVVDELAVIKSMVAQFPEHTSGNYFLHTGSGLQGRPSMGAWVGYGLGSENQNLPGFVVLNGGLIPPGGLDNFNSGYLPAAYQGSIFNPGDNPIANIRRQGSAEQQQRQLALLKELDEQSLEVTGRVDQLESAIANYETAFRMQAAVPELMDLSGETAATKEMYGLNEKFRNTQTFGRQCLLARRLVERGVRFIELTCPGGNGDRWDQHSGLVAGHDKNCRTVDQPIAALIKDLKNRGLLETTLVIWTGEFGRTPFAQGSNGRDHNPFGYTMWMAGGGVKPGISYGATDVFGYKSIENKVEMHDMHATMLHLLGLDHTKVTFRFSSRDMRLTDVHGHVVRDVLA